MHCRVLSEIGEQRDECLYLHFSLCSEQQKQRLNVAQNPIAMINMLVVSCYRYTSYFYLKFSRTNYLLRSQPSTCDNAAILRPIVLFSEALQQFYLQTLVHSSPHIVNSDKLRIRISKGKPLRKIFPIDTNVKSSLCNKIN